MLAAKRAFDDEDTIETVPETLPEQNTESELVEAVEWLKRAGIVSSERPAFSRFFDELVEPAAVTTEVKKKRAQNDD